MYAKRNYPPTKATGNKFLRQNIKTSEKITSVPSEFLPEISRIDETTPNFFFDETSLIQTEGSRLEGTVICHWNIRSTHQMSSIRPVYFSQPVGTFSDTTNGIELIPIEK